MERYEKYKDSGVEWLGILPEHWEVCDFKRLTTRIEVGIAEAATQAYVEKNGVPILRSTNIKRGIIQGELLEISKEFAEKNNSKKIFKNDLITVRTGNAGLTAVIPEYLDGCQCFTLLVTSLKAEADPHFYNYFLNSEIGEYQFSLSAWGTAQKNISVPILGYTKVIFPPKIEQTAIANYLDKKTSKLDTLITKKEKLIELLKEERTAIINQAVTKGLDLDVEMKDSGVEWLGEIPAHWEVKKLKYVFKLVGGFAFKSEDFTDEGIQLIKIGNLYQNKLQLDRQPTFLPIEYKETFKDYLATKGDILLSLTGTLGKRDYGYAILIDEDKDLLVNQRVAKISVKSKMDIDFSINLFQSETYLNQLLSIPTGTKQGNLSGDDVLVIHMPIPSIDEQLEIASFIKNEDSRITNIILLTEQEITLLKEYKTALISEVVTGKVKVI